MLLRNLILSASVAALTLGTASAQTTVTRTTRTTTVHRTTHAAPRRVVYRNRVVRRPVYRTRTVYRNAPRQDVESTSTTTTTSQIEGSPERYYRDGPQYQERTLSSSDRVYAGEDGRYYCRRSDGTTGLIVGGVAGGVLGNVLTSGKSSTLGTLLGAAGGALAGRAVEQGASNRNQDVRCR